MPLNNHQVPKWKVISIVAIKIVFSSKNYSFDKVGLLPLDPQASFY